MGLASESLGWGEEDCMWSALWEEDYGAFWEVIEGFIFSETIGGCPLGHEAKDQLIPRLVPQLGTVIVSV